MKVFVLSLVLFLAVISAVVANAVYVDAATEELIAAARKVLDSGTEKSAEELRALWEGHKPLLCLSASLKDIDSATEYVLRIESAAKQSNAALLEQNCILFFNALCDISRYEQITTQNIL